ncbi:MFS general substrate transporter [Aspergillus crustosus]
MQSDLGMSGNDFSWLATAFFIAYAVAEIPQGVLLQRFPITKVLGGNVFLWGVILCCSAAAKNFAGMCALHVLLGMLEAVIAESTLRYGFWYCGLGMGQIIGGLVSFAAQHAPPEASFHGWRIMFVVIGVVNIAVSLLVLFILPESPEKARFLDSTQRERIAEWLRNDAAGVREKSFRWQSLLEVLGDTQTWLLMLLTILITIPSGVITTFSSILVRDFGYTSKQSALLNMPSGIVSIVSTMLSIWAIGRGYSRWAAIDVLLLPTLLGACFMSFLPKMDQAGCLTGIYLTVAPLALIYAWTGANYKGYTMKIAGSGLVSAAFSIANIIGPQTFQAEDAPGYIPAKITIVAVNASAIVVATTLRILYGMRNSRAVRVGGPAWSRLEVKMAEQRGGKSHHHLGRPACRRRQHLQPRPRDRPRPDEPPTAISDAMAGCDGVLHLASAFTYDVEPGEFEEKLMSPAVRGTRVVCQVASDIESVKKVVIMSSFAAVYDVEKGLARGKVYCEEDWSPVGYADGVDAGVVQVAYRASKVVAERTAWDFVRDHDVQYKLVTLCPGMSNASNKIVWEVLKGESGIPTTKAPVWVDVADLATVSLKALLADLPSHERFLVTAGVYDTQEIADVVRAALPEEQGRIAVGQPGERIKDTHYSCDSSKVQHVLGMEFKGLAESIMPLARQLYALEKGVRLAEE